MARASSPFALELQTTQVYTSTMRKIIAILMFLVSWSAFAEWSGASMWNSYDAPSGDRARIAGGFYQGYFTTVEDVTMMTSADRKAVGLTSLQIDVGQLETATDDFFARVENAEVPVPTALKICLENLISRTADGKRLLNIIYAQVGGWRPFTTWQAYKASR